MNPIANGPAPQADQPLPKPGWNLYILSPEESERMLRDEPRIPADIVLAELYRELGEEPIKQ